MSPPTLAIGEHVSHAQTEQRVIIRFVSWTTYEHLLADLAHQSSTRLTYDRGLLEIMCPLPEHEEWNRTIALLVEVLAEERRVDVRNFGSTTLRSGYALQHIFVPLLLTPPIQRTFGKCPSYQ